MQSVRMVASDIDIRNYSFVAGAGIAAFVGDDFAVDVAVDIDTNVDLDVVVRVAEQDTAALEMVQRIVVLDSSGLGIAYAFAETQLVLHFDDVVASIAVGIESVAIYTCHFDSRLVPDSASTSEAQHDFDCSMVAETSNVVLVVAVSFVVGAPAVAIADRESANYSNESADTEQVN